MKTKVKQNQNILDLAVQHGGDISTAFDLARKNNIEVDEWVQPGSEIETTDAANEEVKTVFSKTNSPASSTITPGEVVTPSEPSVAFGATITLNGAPFIVAPNNAITNISLINQDDDEVIPTEIVDSVITITATASEPQYELIDFFTLDQNNPFGNTERRTDTLGGQAYANNIVIDWYSRKNGRVLGIELGYSVGGLTQPIASTTAQAVSHGGYLDWDLGGLMDMASQIYPMGSRHFGYAPFNDYGNNRYWTKTGALGGTQSYILGNQGGVGLIAYPDSWAGGYAKAFRWFTMAELGL